MGFLLAFVSASLYLTSSAHDLECTAPGDTFRHETDCARYYKCGPDREQLMFQCPEGQLFDPEENKCDASDNVNCAGLEKVFEFAMGGDQHPFGKAERKTDGENTEEQLPVLQGVKYQGDSNIEKRNTDEEVIVDESTLEENPVEKGSSNESSEQEETEIENVDAKTHEDDESLEDVSSKNDDDEQGTENKEDDETQERETGETALSKEDESEETKNESKEEGSIKNHDIEYPHKRIVPFGGLLPFGYLTFNTGSIREDDDFSEKVEEKTLTQKEEVSETDKIESNDESKKHDELEGIKEMLTEDHEQSDTIKHNEDEDEKQNKEKIDDRESEANVEDHDQHDLTKTESSDDDTETTAVETDKEETGDEKEAE